MIVIINYQLGNLASITNALDNLRIPSKVSSDFSAIKKASALILPGVGAAGQGMKNLKSKGLDKVIIDEVKKGKPILGICLGIQLFLSFSEEGKVKCLNLIRGKVKKFQDKLKVPQIGWNQVKIKPACRTELEIQNLFKKIPNNSNFYFVNSYYCELEDKSIISATTNYGINFCSVLIKKNLLGVQFHPEKSGQNGLKLLENFWRYYVN